MGLRDRASEARNRRVPGAPGFYAFLAVMAAIGLVERAIGAVQADAPSTRWWAVVSALAMLALFVSSVRVVVAARRPVPRSG